MDMATISFEFLPLVMGEMLGMFLHRFIAHLELLLTPMLSYTNTTK